MPPDAWPACRTAQVFNLDWATALGATVAVVIVLVVTGRFGGSAGATRLGAAAGLGFGITAAIMKG